MNGGLVKQLRMEAAMIREIAKSEARGIEWRANLSAAAKWCDRASADLDANTARAEAAEARVKVLEEALREAVEWDAYDDEEVPAVWLDKARAALGGEHDK